MIDDIKENFHLAELFDYYQNMLTDKQKKYFELYYFDNYSLQEIANESNISRSAVLDSIEKTKKILNNLENKIGFYKKISLIKKVLEKYANNKIDKNSFIKEIDKELD